VLALVFVVTVIICACNLAFNASAVRKVIPKHIHQKRCSFGILRSELITQHPHPFVEKVLVSPFLKLFELAALHDYAVIIHQRLRPRRYLFYARLPSLLDQAHPESARVLGHAMREAASVDLVEG
jgi:hypothetical protein